MKATTTIAHKCAQPGCTRIIRLEEVSEVIGDSIQGALDAAAVTLGWRRIISTAIVLCPKHAEGLACSRCASEACSCVGGPRFEVQPGGDE